MSKKKMTKQKGIALLTVIAILIQIFSPFQVLTGTVKAAQEYPAVPDENGRFVIAKLMYDESDEYMKQDWEEYRVIPINLILVGDISASGYDIALYYDNQINI